MQAQFSHAGHAIDHTPVAAVDAGSVIVAGADLRIARLDIDANRLGALHVEGGVYDFAHGADVIADGQVVYWDADGDPVGGTAGSGCATGTATGNTPIGIAVGAVIATDATVRVRKVSFARLNPLQNLIADPGHAGAIPVTATGAVNIVTTAAQTRTLAAPSERGQLLSLGMQTDGGDCVITVATGINQAGNTTITMNDAGDSILLIGVQVGANLRWRVVYNDGCTLG